VEEMMQIVPSAHQLGVDTMTFSTLRKNPYSGFVSASLFGPDKQVSQNVELMRSVVSR